MTARYYMPVQGCFWVLGGSVGFVDLVSFAWIWRRNSPCPVGCCDSSLLTGCGDHWTGGEIIFLLFLTAIVTGLFLIAVNSRFGE